MQPPADAPRVLVILGDRLVRGQRVVTIACPLPGCGGTHEHLVAVGANGAEWRGPGCGMHRDPRDRARGYVIELAGASGPTRRRGGPRS